MVKEHGALGSSQRGLLKVIAERGGLEGFVGTTSGSLADSLSVSQQTASRWLRSLEDAGLIERRLGSQGQQLRLTQAGVESLTGELERLERIFEKGSLVTIEGVVSQGEGEGAYYMKQPFYREGFDALFGFEPFPGTLNLSVDGEDLASLRSLRARDGSKIPKVSTPERTFGGVTGFPARVRGEEAAVIFPHRTRHEDVLEVICPVRLRDALGLDDGEVLTVKVDVSGPGKTYEPREELLE